MPWADRQTYQSHEAVTSHDAQARLQPSFLPRTSFLMGEVGVGLLKDLLEEGVSGQGMMDGNFAALWKSLLHRRSRETIKERHLRGCRGG